MKIAVITDDGDTISRHFGRAQYYKVYTVEDGRIVASELRDKAGHHQFSALDHEHEHNGHDDPRGHGYGADADRRHDQMITAITDCEALIVRGMGRGAYQAVQAANIRPVVSDLITADDAVRAYLAGMLQDHTERLH